MVLPPAVFALTVLVLTGLPLWLLAAAFASRWLPGRWRGLRLLWLFVVYLLLESLTLVALFGLWVASGFGRQVRNQRWQRAHYTVMRWYLGVLIHTAERGFNVRFAIDDEEARLVTEGRPPVLVLSRHAGPADSFLLVHGLLRLGYQPRIVLRASMQWAPTVDVALNRVPCFFVRSGQPPGTGTAAVATLAECLGPGDALVLFPEGRNYTPDRRLRSITKLEERGQHGEAEDARELRYVLAPRTGGALAALEAAPHAEVMFIAHTGLEDLSNVVDLWRGLPLDAAIEVAVWRIPPSDIPRPRPAREAWLAWWWRRIDAWILDRYGERAVPDQVADAVTEEWAEPSPRRPDVVGTHPPGPATCFPSLSGEARDVEVVPSGWDRDIQLVDGRLLVRIPRHAEAVPAALAEARLLPILARTLPTAIPRPLAVCVEHGAIVYERIPGEPATAARLTGPAGARVAEQVAAVLHDLRALPVGVAAEAGIPDLSGARWLDHHTQLVARFKRLGLRRLPDGRMAEAARFLTAVPELLERLGAVEDVGIVHADLGPDHVRCDDSGLLGIIDWGDARLGDPAIDLGWALHGAPRDFADRLQEHLDPSPRQVARAAIYHRLGPWFEIEHGVTAGEPALVRSGVAGVLERLPGWRSSVATAH